MSFFGHSFIYDSTPSELFGLYIRDLDASAINSSMGNSSMEIVEKKIYRKATPFFYGATASPRLSFPFAAYADQEIDAESFSLIQKWLFSSTSYKQFQISQIDMQDVLFYAILNEPKIERVGNLVRGFTCTVECNSPFAYRFPKATTYTYTVSTVDSTETYYNGSDYTGDYLYPNLVITMNNFAGDISITNLDDSNRVSSFVDLQANEVLTINCGLQTISSSSGLRRLSNSNKNFLRLVPGVNRLRIVGNVASVVMTNQWIAKKISG